MKVYTCTPMPFGGDERFFTRDSGLFSRGLCRLGHESMAVMPGSPQADDLKELLRVPYKNLESPEFWRGQRLDGVILYSWAAPRYLPIARAIETAGIPFLVNVDSCGLVSRPANPQLWWRDLVPYLMRKAISPIEAARFVAQVVDNLGIHRVARGRLKTYEAATVVCSVSPMASQWLRNEAIHFGREDLAEKIHYLPHPQMDVFSYNGERKENMVLSVARWEREDWAQKHPSALLEALQRFLAARPEWQARVIGSGASQLSKRLGKAQATNLERCEFIDFIQPDQLVPFFCKAKIGFWSSRSEGQIGTGAQALCCGCSVVSGNAGTLSCFHHYASRESGRLATGMKTEAMAEALMLEADAWEVGQRDAHRISSIWGKEFHSTKVAERALQMLGLSIPKV